ncbi:MAG: long-chain fatty acid--CoA ligase [Chthoniobacterales bacterium]
MSKPLSVKTLAELYRCAADHYGERPAFARRNPDGSYSPITFRGLYETGLNLATALIERGLEAREHVGILSDNRLEWIMADCGVLLAGAANVPRASDITEDEIVYIMQHADVRTLFIENLAVFKKFEACQARIPSVKNIILMDMAVTPPAGIWHLEELIQQGARLRLAGDRRAEARADAVQPEDLFTLIYTSGTTGIPKGVQLSHANMCSQVRNLPLDLRETDKALSILPIWHSYERIFAMVAIGHGCCTYYTSIRTLADDLKSVQPTLMASAPRLWESLYEKIISRVKQGSIISRSLFHVAYKSARAVHRAKYFFRGQTLDQTRRTLRESLTLAVFHLLNFLLYFIPYRILDALVLAKLRQVVGGNFRGTISGGGALPPHVDEFFNFIGIPVLEGYGLTESSPVLAVRTWKNLVIGTVGPLYPETEIRIVDLDSGEILYPNKKKRGNGRGLRGEIHAKGPQVMRGYYKNETSTNAVLKDGWLKTGDIGMMTFNDCLKILGRSKDTIVLLSGENVEPLPIENKLCESDYILQCMVIGQDEKHLGALLVPHIETFKKNGYNIGSIADLEENPEAMRVLQSEIRRLVSAQQGFKPFERIAVWRNLPKPFDLGDELTATYKLKRHVITEKYGSLIKAVYAHQDS